MVDANQWARVKELFHAALEREEPERSVFLADACRDDLALRAEIDRLLLANAQSADFIERSAEFGTPMTGRVLGRLEVGALIGVGGMGEVYVARDVELGRQVALKIASGTNDAAHARLRREAQHASQLNHPHICTIHEVGEMDGRAYIVMEYVEGTRLADLVPRGGLPIETVFRLGTQIADALAHAHLRGIIHRDLKATNVVVTPEGRAKVLDFGLAQSLSPENLKELSESQASVSAEGVMAGTLSCMAPELLRGAPADGRSDIWALGVLLYEMSTGKRPFAGTTCFELSAAILHEAPPALPAQVPQSLQSIIRRCLVKNPADRYQQAEEVRSALEAACATGTGPVRRNHTRAAVAGLLIALTAAAGLTWRMGRPAVTPAAGISPRLAIAVMPFARIDGEQDRDGAWMSNGVPSMLLTGLRRRPVWKSLEPSVCMMHSNGVEEPRSRRSTTARQQSSPGMRAPARSSLAAFSAWGRKSGSMPSSRTCRAAGSSSRTVCGYRSLRPRRRSRRANPRRDRRHARCQARCRSLHLVAGSVPALLIGNRCIREYADG